MPIHSAHNAHDVLFFKCAYGQYDQIHKLLDTAFVKMFDKKHRKVLHDPSSVEAVRQQFGDHAAMVATHHIYMDSPTRYNAYSVAIHGRLVDLR